MERGEVGSLYLVSFFGIVINRSFTCTARLHLLVERNGLRLKSKPHKSHADRNELKLKPKPFKYHESGYLKLG